MLFGQPLNLFYKYPILNYSSSQVQKEIPSFSSLGTHKYRKDARKYAKKVQMIESLFVVPSDDHELTLKAIKTIVERVGES